MKIIACYNIKGGVGKTATVVNLSYLCATQGYRALIWDLDPQGAASFYYRIKPKIKGGGKKLIHKQSAADEAVKATDFENLDLLPADFSYRNLDIVLEDMNNPLKRLQKVLKPLKQMYDFVFLDCAPSISLVSESVLYTSDLVLVPTIPTTLSLRTYEQILRFCEKSNINTDKLIPFFSMVDRRKLLHRMILDKPPNIMKNLIQIWIPNTSEVEKMGVQRMPVMCFAAASPAALAYQKMWDEVKALLSA